MLGALVCIEKGVVGIPLPVPISGDDEFPAG